jgi:hypothetical protein
MFGAIVLTAIGVWVFVCVLALGLCRQAKMGDQATEILYGRYSGRNADWIVLDQRQDDRPRSVVRQA